MSLLIFLSGIHMNLGLGTIIIAHTTFCLPFVYLMVSARVDEFDYSIIEASHDLGANEKQTLFKVIIPAIMPGIMSGFMMSVTMSIEDFVITSLVNGNVETLPIYVYNMIRHGGSPVINALSFVLILLIGGLEGNPSALYTVCDNTHLLLSHIRSTGDSAPGCFIISSAIPQYPTPQFLHTDRPGALSLR